MAARETIRVQSFLSLCDILSHAVAPTLKAATNAPIAIILVFMVCTSLWLLDSLQRNDL